MPLKNIIRYSLIVSALLVSVPLLAGCGSEANKPESIATPQRVEEVVQMRKIFDEVKQPDFEKVPADKKAAFTKLAGDEAKARFMWNKMAHPGLDAAPPK